jgi:hypothetical protein
MTIVVVDMYDRGPDFEADRCHAFVVALPYRFVESIVVGCTGEARR